MDDRTLLEKAAKAAGIEIHASDDGTLQCRPIWAVYHYVQGQPYVEVEWNPLRDDAEALRLAVKMRIELLWDDGAERVKTAFWGDSRSWGERPSDHAADSCAATRRAIVRAAASMEVDK